MPVPARLPSRGRCATAERCAHAVQPGCCALTQRTLLRSWLALGPRGLLRALPPSKNQQRLLLLQMESPCLPPAAPSIQYQPGLGAETVITQTQGKQWWVLAPLRAEVLSRAICLKWAAHESLVMGLAIFPPLRAPPPRTKSHPHAAGLKKTFDHPCSGFGPASLLECCL